MIRNLQKKPKCPTNLNTTPPTLTSYDLTKINLNFCGFNNGIHKLKKLTSEHTAYGRLTACMRAVTTVCSFYAVIGKPTVG